MQVTQDIFGKDTFILESILACSCLRSKTQIQTDSHRVVSSSQHINHKIHVQTYRHFQKFTVLLVQRPHECIQVLLFLSLSHCLFIFLTHFPNLSSHPKPNNSHKQHYSWILLKESARHRHTSIHTHASERVTDPCRADQ